MTDDVSKDMEQAVYIVDDEPAVRDAVAMLVRSVGLRALEFESAVAFIEAYDGQPGVLILDVRLPAMSGLELQQVLNERGVQNLAILFMSGHSDIPIAVEALKHGAADFLEKPFRDQDLLDRVHEALRTNQQGLEESREIRTIQQRIGSLTPRERQVMELVADGKANKVIAMDLNISQRTVELHRSHVMDKMGVQSLAQLVRTLARVESVPG